jgi:hypothetical protein
MSLGMYWSMIDVMFRCIREVISSVLGDCTYQNDDEEEQRTPAAQPKRSDPHYFRTCVDLDRLDTIHTCIYIRFFHKQLSQCAVLCRH